MYWDIKHEMMDKKQIEIYQLERLNKTLEYSLKTPYYKSLFNKINFKGFNSIDDIKNIPFTTKDDLRGGFPYGMLAVDLDDVVRLHSSSGTTGVPTVVYLNRNDLNLWSDLVARNMYMVGGRKSDVFQNMMGYGLFTGGIGFHYGAESVGMLTIPSGPGNSQRQIWFMQQFKTTIIHILPSYALRLSDHIKEAGVDIKKDLNLRMAYIGAEPHSAEIRKKIEEIYGIKAYNSYGLSEMCGPGVAFECEHQNGMHIWEDYFYPEIIDPVTERVLDDGEEGELVLTTLRKEAMPIFRYRTRDLTRIIPGKCKCGREHRRIERIKGRSDDMLIINGVNLFPIQIEKSLMSELSIGTNYLIEVIKENHMDKIIVNVEINSKHFGGTLYEVEQLQKKLIDKLKTELLVTPIVKIHESGTLPSTEGKAQRVIDHRNKGE